MARRRCLVPSTSRNVLSVCPREQPGSLPTSPGCVACILPRKCITPQSTASAGKHYCRHNRSHCDRCVQTPLLPTNGAADLQRVPSNARRRWAILSAAVRLSGNQQRNSDAGEGYLCTDRVEATLLQCLKTLDFWLLTFAVSACTGISLAFINNAGSIVRSLGGDKTITVCVPFARRCCAVAACMHAGMHDWLACCLYSMSSKGLKAEGSACWEHSACCLACRPPLPPMPATVQRCKCGRAQSCRQGSPPCAHHARAQ